MTLVPLLDEGFELLGAADFGAVLFVDVDEGFVVFVDPAGVA